MDKSKIRSLATIAALREEAENFRNAAPDARTTAEKIGEKKGSVAKNMEKILQEEALTFETVAADLEAIADEIAHYRAFATARFLVGPVALISEEEAASTIGAIRSARAYMEHTAPLSVPQKSTCTVRLVPFYDAELDEERWAVHYTNTDGDEGISDNAAQEDAEFRYWEIAGPLGAVKPE